VAAAIPQYRKTLQGQKKTAGLKHSAGNGYSPGRPPLYRHSYNKLQTEAFAPLPVFMPCTLCFSYQSPALKSSTFNSDNLF